jgi:hypothetical protein
MTQRLIIFGFLGRKTKIRFVIFCLGDAVSSLLKHKMAWQL